MPGTPLDLGCCPEDAAQSLAPVQHHQHAVGDPQAPLQEVPQEGGAGRGVLRARLHEAQQDLLPTHRDPQRDHHGIVGEHLPVQEQRDDVVLLQATFLQGLELAGRGPDVAPGDTRSAQAKRLGDRLGRGPIVPATQPIQHPPQHALIGGPWLLEPLVTLERDLHPRLPVADPRHQDRQLLVGEVDRARLSAPAHQVRDTVVTRIPGPGQRVHFLLEDVPDRLQAQGDQRLDERDPGVKILSRWNDRLVLALGAVSQYCGHGAASSLWCVGFPQQSIHHTGDCSFGFSTGPGTPSPEAEVPVGGQRRCEAVAGTAVLKR